MNVAAPPAGVGRVTRPPARTVLALLRLYREAISPLRPACCRYSPTCSAYAVEAVEVHGAVRGLWLALRRLLRCHPLHRGGHDPVPAARSAPADGHPTRTLPARPTDPRSSAARPVGSVPA